MQQLTKFTRITCLVIGAPALWPAYDLGRAGLYGRGGWYALCLAGSFLLAGAVLGWIAASGVLRSASENTRMHFVRWTTATAVASYACISIGIATHPGSNIPGLIGLFGGIVYIAAVPASLIAALAWIQARTFGSRSGEHADARDSSP